MPNGPFYLISLDRPICNTMGVWLVFIITLFYRNTYTLCSVDRDRTPRYAASDQGLHCLSMSHKWVK